MVFQDVLRFPPSLMNVVTNVSCLSVSKATYGDEGSDNGQSWMVRRELKRIVLMKNVVLKFSKFCQLVFHAFAGSLSVAKECLLLYRLRKLVRYEKDLVHLQQVISGNMVVYAIRLLNRGSYLTGDEQLNDPTVAVPGWVETEYVGRIAGKLWFTTWNFFHTDVSGACEFITVHSASELLIV